jgi:hypothetical protein
MARIQENEFTIYDFEDGELEQATHFTTLNLQYIRTIKGRAASEKASLGFVDLTDTAPILRAEYLRGLMAGMDLLLQENAAREAERLQNVEASMQGQSNYSQEVPHVDLSKLFRTSEEE